LPLRYQIAFRVTALGRAGAELEVDFARTETGGLNRLKSTVTQMNIGLIRVGFGNDMRPHETFPIGAMSKRPPHILFVSGIREDRSSISAYLSGQQFRITVVSRGRNALVEFEANKIDAVVLDVANESGTGLELCRKLREMGAFVPIILFTNGGDPVDRIIGFELGADDCVEKPVNGKELAARIRARLRTVEHRQEQGPDRYRFAGLLLDVKERKITGTDGSPIGLTSAEFDLLATFVARTGRRLSRGQLLDLTERHVVGGSGRSIDVLVSRLRRKLFAATNRELISTIRNGGYQFTADVNLLYGPGIDTTLPDQLR